MTEEPSLSRLLEAVKYYKSEYDVSSLVALDCVRIDQRTVEIREDVIAGLKDRGIQYLPSSRTIEKLRDFIHSILISCNPDIKEIRDTNKDVFMFVDKNGKIIKYSSIVLNYIVLLHEEDREDRKLLNVQENRDTIMQAVRESSIDSSKLEDAVEDALPLYDSDKPTFKESMLYGTTGILEPSIYGRALRYQTTKRLEVERKTALFYILSATDQDDAPEERIHNALIHIDEAKELLGELRRCTNALDSFLLRADIENRLLGMSSADFTTVQGKSTDDQMLMDQIDYIRVSIKKNQRWLQKYFGS